MKLKIMSSYSTLRIQPPPDDSDEIKYVKISYMNIIFMLVLASFLHMSAFLVTNDYIFFWLGVLFSSMSLFVICVSLTAKY